MKKLLSLLSWALFHLSMAQPYTDHFTDDITRFLQQIEGHALHEMKVNQILSSITMAQAILETGYGKSKLAQKANNFFGIKGQYDGCTYHYKNDYYRCYPDLDDSFRDHSDFLLRKPAIQRLIDSGNLDFRYWAYTLELIKYAEDPEYGKKLIDIIQRYGLDRFDKLSVNQAPKPRKKDRQIHFI